MDAFLDMVRVLYEPQAVFARVGEKPRWWQPFVVLAVIAVILAVLLRPFSAAATQQMIAQLPPEQQQRAAGMGGGRGILGLVFAWVPLALYLVIGVSLLWVFVSLLGSEAKFGTLFSVLTYAFATYILYAGISATVLMVRGVESVTSLADLRPAVGLDLLAPGAGPFVGTVLNGINPFSVWGVWLTGTGIATTLKTSRGAGIAAATGAFGVGLLISAAITAVLIGMMRR